MIIVGLIIIVDFVTVRWDVSRAYIDALEEDYPEFVDTTSGTDAYSDYYKYHRY